MTKEIPVECYTRIVGYFRPVSESNKGKKSEILERKMIDVKKMLEKDLI